MKNLFLSFFEISVSTSLIVLALLMFSPLLNRRYASKWKYYIWIALAFRLLIPFHPNLSLRQVISFFHYKTSIIKKGTCIENSLILHQLHRLRKDLRIKNNIAIIKYPGAVSPMIIGFFRPLLVLPDNEYSQEELFFILKHELIHLKQHDVYFKLLFVIANAIHWFNPFIYVMQKEAGIDMELSCDEKVIQGTAYAVRKAYTETLLSTLRKQYNKTKSLTTQFYGGDQIMKRRFKNILLKSKKKNGFSILVCAVIITVFLGMMAGCSIREPGSSKVQKTNELPSPQTDNNEISTEQTDPAQTPGPEGSEPDGTNNPENTLSEDGEMVKSIAESFAEAYFSGNTDTVQSYLTNPYEWDIETYTGTGTISEVTLKGLTDMEEEEVGSLASVSLEFRDSDYEDMFLYLTIEFVKQEDGWKIQFYGLEG